MSSVKHARLKIDLSTEIRPDRATGRATEAENYSEFPASTTVVRPSLVNNNSITMVLTIIIIIISSSSSCFKVSRELQAGQDWVEQQWSCSSWPRLDDELVARLGVSASNEECTVYNVCVGTSTIQCSERSVTATTVASTLLHRKPPHCLC